MTETGVGQPMTLYEALQGAEPGPTMRSAIRAMLGSKTVLAAVAGVVAGILGRIGLGLAVEVVLVVLGPLAAYIVGQGVADAGKEAEKLRSQRGR